VFYESVVFNCYLSATVQTHHQCATVARGASFPSGITYNAYTVKTQLHLAAEFATFLVRNSNYRT